jgi:hypothetical protein
MGCHVRKLGLVLSISIAALVAVPGAQAGCGRSDNPMVWNNGFGVSQCLAHKPRYHKDAFRGERARGYAQSSDPMVWSDTQWGSTLFGGYSHNTNGHYDRRFRRDRGHVAHRHMRIERRVEITVRNDMDVEVEKPKARRARYISSRPPGDMRAGPGVLRFGGHDCRGVLVLTWGALGGKSRCHRSDGHIKVQ